MYTHGQKIGSYRVTKVLPIEELSLTYYEVIHEKSGAQIVYIDADDPENLFCLSFKTYPDSSNGVAHILEHTVLCGSKKFPVKDPFFSMTRRSLNTFMNAMTGADFTCYPAASQLEKDFYNLLDVYIDACFFPNLTKESFLQEGHRLEFETPNDSTSPLQYKGIVFNEMKGALSSPDARLWNEVSKHLLPDLTYSFNSGGDPKEIPSLTYEGLLEFHKAYYHPSRCIFFFYGNIPLETHLAFLEKRLLQGLSGAPLPPLSPLKKQTRFTAPKKVTTPFPFSEEDTDKKSMVAFSFLTTAIENQKELLALSVLDAVLMENDASPLRRALLETKLCSHVEGYMDSEMSEVPYLIVCKGTNPEDAERLSATLFEVLREICKTGIPPEMIEAAVHELEFERSEITGDYGPFGLTLFFRSVLGKQHGAAPEDCLQIHSIFSELLLLAKDPTFFTKLIQTHFIDNPHFLTVTMVPDTSLSEKELAEENSKLSKITATLSESEKTALTEQAKHLDLFQEKNEPLSCLPKLALSDIPKDPTFFPLETIETDSSKIVYHTCFTNHIFSIDVLFDMPHVEEEDLPYLQLLISILTELGTEGHTFAANLLREQRYTGGISASISLFENSQQKDVSHPAFILRGKALSRNVEEMLRLLHEYAYSARFDEKERIKELVLQIHTHLEQKLSRSPLSYAALDANAPFSSHAHVRNVFAGLPYVHFMRNLAKNLDTLIDGVCERLSTLYMRITQCGSVVSVVTADKETFSQHKSLLTTLFTHGSGNLTPWKIGHSTSPVHSQIRTIASPVAFTAHAFRTLYGTDPLSPAIAAAASIFENGVLHKRIREQGGAYGSGASYTSQSGHFHFYAYRDPHIEKTLKAFREACEILAKGKCTRQDIDEAIFSIIQSADTPCAPLSRAMTAYSHLRACRTFALRKTYRSNLLSITKEHIVEATKTHILPLIEGGCTSIFCGEALAAKEPLFPIQPA